LLFGCDVHENPIEKRRQRGLAAKMIHRSMQSQKHFLRQVFEVVAPPKKPSQYPEDDWTLVGDDFLESGGISQRRLRLRSQRNVAPATFAIVVSLMSARRRA